ncbi:alginate export family protein [Robbsia andropogonis]|uniref:alginate export family protein n=1 Tax=Robbsia andropogonis TaxID=28092 RepID=UPI000696C3FA|nr:alginate export family protein [Robbsia andropogonis]
MANDRVVPSCRRRCRDASWTLRALVLGAGLGASSVSSFADNSAKVSVSEATSTCSRPAIAFNRWQENWSVLQNGCVPKKPFDSLKYIPLFGNRDAYISLGTVLRERLEVNDAPLYGLGSGHSDTYLIQRVEVHADVHLGERIQLFTQIESALPYGKDRVSVVDRNPLDLRQAFVTFTQNTRFGVVKARVGRQEMAFDLQRFVAVRDGPNVRQAFDGVWADFETGRWRWIAYATQPVQYRDASDFDDVSNRDLTFSGVRVERQSVGPGDVSAYYSRYNRRRANFIDGSGDEHRDVFDVRYTGKTGNIDWDAEAMYQSGHVGSNTIGAWAVGSLAGYTFNNVTWAPRLGLQIDAASGDRHPHDGRIGTFNPLFPNGYYFALAGYTGYSNLIHIKPSLTLKPSSKWTLLLATGLQWRETTSDAVYQQGSASVPGTAGFGSLWTGFYTQFRADYAVNANITAALEAVHFQIGKSLREVGAKNADYIGAELKFAW